LKQKHMNEMNNKYMIEKNNKTVLKYAQVFSINSDEMTRYAIILLHELTYIFHVMCVVCALHFSVYEESLRL